MLVSGCVIWSWRVLFQIFVLVISCDGVSETTSLAVENRPLSASVEVGPALLLRKFDGSTSGVRFVQGTSGLTADARLTEGETLEFPARPFPLRSSLPVRIVTLWTGEVIPVSWNQPGGKKGAVSRFDGQLYSGHSFAESEHSRITLRISDVATIRQPVGTSDVCPADSQVRPEGVWQQVDSGGDKFPEYVSPLIGTFWKRQAIRLPMSNAEAADHRCLVVVSGRWPAGVPGVRNLSVSDQLRSGGTLKFIFADNQGLRHRIAVSGRGGKRMTVLPDGRRKFANVSTQRLQIQVLVDRGLTLSSNGVVLSKLKHPLGRLDSIEVEGPFVPPIADEPDGMHALYIQNPLVRRTSADSIEAAKSGSGIAEAVRKGIDIDRVILNSGDEIYGNIADVSDLFRLRSSSKRPQRLLVDRKDVAAVSFARSKVSTWEPVVGEFARIDLVPDMSCSFGGIEEPFWIRSAILRATDEGIMVQHSLLGKIRIRWEMIRRITPLFAGSYQLLDPGPRHPGNGIRESFSRVEPDGTELSLSFALVEKQLGLPTFLSTDIAEMIPSGPDTLKATPFLDEVRNGFLATQVLLNGKVVGNLNQLIKVRSLAANPQRVRMSLPTRLLKVGKNTIEVRQTSAKDDPASFDDCELRAIAVEIEHDV
jgi:hypothetical protein